MYYQTENFNGIYDFRCRFHNGFIMESHIHEYSEILYCQNGNCEISVNGKTICLNADEFVLIPPNYIHQYTCIDVEVICAVFSNDFIPLFCKEVNGKKLRVKAVKAGKLKPIFEKLPSIGKNRSVLLSAYLNLICDKVLENADFEKTCKTDGVLYQKVISYIADNFKHDISLKKIAAEFGYNPKYLSDALHSLTGVHFADFIAMYRIEYAKKLLTKSNATSVTEISMECGFAAVNTFNRQFKKLTSMTPTEYRKIYAVNSPK